MVCCVIFAATDGSVSAVTFSTGTGGTLAGELLECCGCKRLYPLCVCVCVCVCVCACVRACVRLCVRA